MSLEQVVLYPHPPIALPEVAGIRFKEVEKTAKAMLDLSQYLVKSSPETIIIITPHANIHPTNFMAFSEPEITGNFSMFGAPQVQIKLKNNLQLLELIVKHRQKENKKDIAGLKPGTKLDHGSGVPLYYLLKAGYKGDVVVINYTFASQETHMGFGRTLASVAASSKQKIALLASGDLSHRIIASAPAGYHPDGKKFDELIVDSINIGDYETIAKLDPMLRENAGECAYNSLMVAFGALDFQSKNNKIYSYEAPFGVGYLVASL